MKNPPTLEEPPPATVPRPLAESLREYAERYETATFTRDDPSLFMHIVEGDENRETTAFVASTLSYGSRRQFMPKIKWLLDISRGDMFGWIKGGLFNGTLPDDGTRFYRFYTTRDMNALLRALQGMLNAYGSMGRYVRSRATDGYTAISALTDYFRGKVTGGMVPKDTVSACKRLCMFMRWMARAESPVDIGLWHTFIDRRSLIMPLDTHVFRQAMQLELLTGGAPSMAAAQRLTDKMKEIFPEDPLKGDFALFGYGVNHNGEDVRGRTHY